MNRLLLAAGAAGLALFAVPGVLKQAVIKVIVQRKLVAFFAWLIDMARQLMEWLDYTAR